MNEDPKDMIDDMIDDSLKFIDGTPQAKWSTVALLPASSAEAAP